MDRQCTIRSGRVRQGPVRYGMVGQGATLLRYDPARQGKVC